MVGLCHVIHSKFFMLIQRASQRTFPRTFFTSRSIEKFTEILDNILRSLDRHSRKHIVFTGDYNVDLVKHEKDVAGQNLIAVYEKYGFVQLVSK